MGRKDPPTAVAVTGGAGIPESITCDMAREEGPSRSRRGRWGCRNPRKSRECGTSLRHHRQRPRATVAIATAAVTAAAVTTRILATATDSIAAATAPNNATGAAAAFTTCRPGTRLSQHGTGGWRSTAGTDEARDRAPSWRAYGAWAAAFDSDMGGYLSYTLPLSSTGQKKTLPTRPASELSTLNSCNVRTSIHRD